MSNIIRITPINYQLLTTNTFTILLPKAFVYSNNVKNFSVITTHVFYEIIDKHGNKSYTKPEYW